jgi:nitrogen regulatory protein PII
MSENNSSSTSTLPYEVREQKEIKGTGSGRVHNNNNITSNKKRIEAIIPSEKTDSVLTVLESMNIQATFYESKGMGRGEKYTISYGKGGKTTKMPYSTRHTVVTIIDENKVGEVINAIRQSAKMANKSNVGIVVISSVEDILTI